MTNNLCPVCGYDLGFPAWEGSFQSDEICPSCGVQFGYDDMIRVKGDEEQTRVRYKELREKWFFSGMIWWSKNPLKPKPLNWNPKEQLKNIGIKVE